MNFRIVTTVAAIVACAPASPPSQGSKTSRAAEAIDRLAPTIKPKSDSNTSFTLAQRMKYHMVPAVSIAVIDSGRIVWSAAFGLKNDTDSASTTTLFQAASISKPVASLGTMRLVQEGKLALDEDVNARLTTWKVPASRFTQTEKVTLRRIMSHSAGLTVHGFPGYASSDSVPTTVQILDGLKPANTLPVRVDVVPGSLWRYSGGGMTVMQLLVSEVTGTPYPEFLRTAVLQPLGMTRSTYEQPLPAARASEAATGYRPDGKAIVGRWHTYPEMAAAGLWTTPEDLSHMIIGVQQMASAKSQTPLSQESIRQMLTLTKGSYGLGFAVDTIGGVTRFSHGGANEGFRAQFMGFVETGQGVAVMTNSDNGGALVGEIIAALAAEYGWKGSYGLELDVVGWTADQRAGAAGRYQVVGQPFVVSISTASDSLFIEVPGEIRRSILFPTSDSTLVGQEGGVTLTLARDKRGRVTSLAIDGAMRATRIK